MAIIMLDLENVDIDFFVDRWFGSLVPKSYVVGFFAGAAASICYVGVASPEKAIYPAMMGGLLCAISLGVSANVAGDLLLAMMNHYARQSDNPERPTKLSYSSKLDKEPSL